jgi:hypothetical protein
VRITQSQLKQIIKEELEAVLSEKAEKTVSAEISAQKKKGKPQDQAVAIALSKKERGEVRADEAMNEEELDERCQKGYKTHKTRKTKKMYGKTYRNCVKAEELELDEKKKRKKKKKKKKKGKDDRCTRIAKRKYDVWPSAYASGAVVRCRAGKIWKGVKEAAGDEEDLERKIRRALRDEKGAAGMDALVKHTDASEADIKGAIEEMDDVGRHEDGDYILGDGDTVDILDEDLRKWFGRKGAPGKKRGWVDCNTCRKDKKTGRKKCKPCGREKGEKRSKYPACRPTPGACKSKGRGKKWGKKSKRKTNEMISPDIQKILFEKGQEFIFERVILPHLTEAFLEDGTPVCVGCLAEQLDEASCNCPHLVYEAEYRGRKVTLNKPTRGDVKKFKVYVKDPKTGNVKKVNFGHGGTSAKKKGEKTMKIRKNNPKARKSFRARHNCKNPGPKTKARYWSCKKW